MTKATKRQFLVTVEGIPGTWRGFSGGGATAETTTDWDGGAERPDILGGPPTYDDLELVRTYDPERDAGWIERLDKLVGRGRFTLTKQPTDLMFTKVGKPRTYADCLLKGLTEPEADAESGDKAEITLVFATTGPA